MVLKDKVKKTYNSTNDTSDSQTSQKTPREIKTIKAKDKNAQEEKEGIWEYVVIFGGALLFFVAIYFAFEYFDDRGQEEPHMNVYRLMGITDEGFIHQTTTYNGRQANIEFIFDRDTIGSFDFRQDLTNEWFETNREIRIATPDRLDNRTQNAILVRVSGKFASYLGHIQGIRFDEQSFFTSNNVTSCEQSGPESSLIIYNLDTQERGVIIPEEYPHCVLINAESTTLDFAKAIDKIMFDTIIGEE